MEINAMITRKFQEDALDIMIYLVMTVSGFKFFMRMPNVTNRIISANSEKNQYHIISPYHQHRLYNLLKPNF